MSEAQLRQEFRLLYLFEYGSPLELLFRLCLIGLATIAFTLAIGWKIGFYWLAIYYGTHALNFGYFCLRWHNPRQIDLFIVSAGFVALVGTFVWLPGFLLLQVDHPSLQLAGTAAISGLLVWLIKRGDKRPGLMWAEISLLAIAAATLFYFAQPLLPSLPEKVGVLLCCIGLVFYFGKVMFIARETRMRTEAAHLRTAEAQKMEALGHLAGGVAHDFNNILTAVIGNLELHREVQSDREKDQCIAEALLAARSGGTLVRKLLHYGRRAPEARETMVLGDMVESLSALGRRLVPAPVKVVIGAKQADLILPVQEDELTTALLNLMVNARDAMPEGGELKVCASLEVLHYSRMMLDRIPIPAGDYVHIEVSDTGSGIPSNVLDRVLEPFFTTKPEGQGSGLGLPMAAAFARSVGGGLMIRTSPSGTHVSLYLPLNKPKEGLASADAA